MKIAIHEVTFTVSFSHDDYLLSAEMAAMLVRECEQAEHKVNEYFQPPKPAYQPVEVCERKEGEVHHDDPF